MSTSNIAYATPGINAQAFDSTSAEATSTTAQLKQQALPVPLSSDSISRSSAAALMSHNPVFCPCGGCATSRATLLSGSGSGSNQTVAMLSGANAASARPTRAQKFIGDSVLVGILASAGIFAHSTYQFRSKHKQSSGTQPKPHRP